MDKKPNNLHYTARKHATTYIVLSSALLLLTLSFSVLYVWHHLNLLPYIPKIILMSYNSAVCMSLSGISLCALISSRVWLLRICMSIVLLISGITFLEMIEGPFTRVNYWFMRILTELPPSPHLMSPTSASCFLLISLALLMLGSNLELKKNKFIIPIIFLSMIALTISAIALLGHGLGLIPAFVWLGIKMAPHTAAGLSLLALTIVIVTYSQAINSFNRLNFFSRVITGFGFIAILVVAMSSIAFMQINTVSSIAHEIYNKPFQINNAVTRIKTEINTVNRSLKNIAIKPEISDYQRIPKLIESTNILVQKEILEMRTYDPLVINDLDNFANKFENWKKYVLESYGFLKRNAHESYVMRTLYDGQDQVFELESILSYIDAHAQQRISKLNGDIANTENDAKKMVIFIVIGFLVIGMLVAALITRSLTNQLKKIRAIMLDIAQEKLDGSVPFIDHQQEIGDMARTLAMFSESIAARRQLEMRLRQVIETMPNGIVMIDRSGLIEIVNAQAEKIFGYDRSELLGKPVEILIPTNAAKAHPHNRKSFFENPSPRMMGAGRELFGLRRDGTEFPLEIGLAPIAADDGMKVLASIVDITERRNAEIALNESRERLELTTRVNQIGVWEYNPETEKLYWNETMFEIYGRNAEYFSSDINAWTQCVHPDDLVKTQKLLADAIENLTPFISKFRIIQPDGTIKHILAKSRIDRTPSNNLRILGTNIDITREELAFLKLHNLEALRSAIVEFSEDAIISKTPQGIITSWNSGATNMFGHTEGEVIGKSISNIIFDMEHATEVETLLVKVRMGEVVKHFETVCHRKNGDRINVSLTLSPIKDTAGNVIGISAIKRDITESLKATQMLAERKKELEISNSDLARSNKELETFAYVASHDLKSPLRGIAQLSVWVEEDIEAGEFKSISGHTSMMRNRIQRMEKLLDDLLIFYRAGKVEGELTSVDVSEMGREVFEIQNTKQGLRLELGDNLPTFSTLSVPLEQVIRNFFSNAIKHHDKEYGIISLNCKNINDDFYEFTVCDDGPGIPEKFQERVFGMFQTLKPRDELEGSGMGLALIKKIVENYEGNVTIFSQGRGCCFSFTWPKDIHRKQYGD